jgi:hypothetical protein
MRYAYCTLRANARKIRDYTLKKIILIVVICLGAWGYYQKRAAHTPSIAIDNPDLISEPSQKAQPAISKNESQFKCDGREYCGQMTTRAEAEFFLRNCPNTKMDGDNDGIPCENDSRF